MQAPLQRVSNECPDGQFLFSPMHFISIFFFGLSAILFYHDRSISLLYHCRFGGQIENGPMDSFTVTNSVFLLVQTFLLYDDFHY